jgi:hypothetical protein
MPIFKPPAARARFAAVIERHDSTSRLQQHENHG